MTEREEEILKIIKNNPLISQQEIANYLNITRSSVGVHITNLMKKGYIIGKGYIVREDPYIAVLGGANVDIVGFPYGDLKMEDSNPGKTNISLGGVGRNIGENLARLGIDTRLITVIGNDTYGKLIVDEGRKIGLDMSDSLILQDATTSTYLCILDEGGDLKVAISSMDIFEKMNIKFIEEKKDIIENAKVCIVDTNLPIDVLKYMVKNFRANYFLDPVSAAKASKVKNIIGYFHTITPNKIEAEILSGKKIKKEEDLKSVGKYFINEGVKRVLISLGEKGIYYFDGNREVRIIPPKVKVINTTGAGDAFIAGLAYAYFNNFNIEETLKFSLGMSIMTLEDNRTINPNISLRKINEKVKGIKI